MREEETGPVRDTALTELDTQLERLENTIVAAERTFAPILLQYDSEKVMSEPPESRPDPPSQLRGRAERLRDLNAQFDRLLNRLDI